MKKEESINKKNVARELRILKFMLKHDVFYHHHGQESSMKEIIKKQIEYLRERNTFEIYDSYIWNHLGKGNNYKPLSWLDFVFKSCEFDNVYDIPLDGSYKFYAYDSGSRGLGSFSYLSVSKVEKPILVPKVNPGAIIPVTC